MKKTLATVACALALVTSLSLLPNMPKHGLFAVDTVSAATDTSAPATSTSGKTTTSYTSGKVSRILQLGSSGSDVSLVQTNLNAKGYKLTVDGFFGNLTLNAVKAFQKDNNLDVDGLIGPKTMAVLIPSSVVPTSIVQIGSSGGDVNYLQTNLNKLGYKLTVDGIFGKLTQDAVKSFQKDTGLVVDGIAGPKTFGKLFDKTTAPAPAAPTTPTTPAPPTTPTPPPADTVSSASITDNADVFAKSIGKDGKWIIAVTKDLTFNKELSVDGDFYNEKTPPVLQRKIALYTQDDKRNITARFTLTAPKITINSPYASIEHGTFKGDIYVNAQNFKLVDATVDGNIYFTNQAAKDTFNLSKPLDVTTKVTGKQALVQLDAVTSASIVDNTNSFKSAISSTGKWIIATLRDLTTTENLVLDGTFNNTKTPPAQQRKIALYSQDDKHVVTRRFTLTAPSITIKSPSASMQHGIFKGDIYVSADNFQLVDQVVNGNIYFTTQSAKNTFKPLDATSKVTGVMQLKTN